MRWFHRQLGSFRTWASLVSESRMVEGDARAGLRQSTGVCPGRSQSARSIAVTDRLRATVCGERAGLVGQRLASWPWQGCQISRQGSDVWRHPPFTRSGNGHAARASPARAIQVPTASEPLVREAA